MLQRAVSKNLFFSCPSYTTMESGPARRAVFSSGVFWLAPALERGQGQKVCRYATGDHGSRLLCRSEQDEAGVVFGDARAEVSSVW